MKTQVTLGKLVALAVAMAYVIAAFALERSWAFALTVAAGSLLPLSLIWFPEFLGGLAGWGSHARIDKPSPPAFVGGMGWLFLLGLPVLVFFLNA